MADKSTLGILGFVFAAITAACMVIAVLVVRDHVQGRLVLDSANTVASMSMSTVR